MLCRICLYWVIFLKFNIEVLLPLVSWSARIMHFFCTFRCRSRSFHDVRWHDHKCWFLFLISNRCYQFSSRILKIHFANIMTWNNWEMITKARSFISKWPFRFRRRRPFLRLLKMIFGHLVLSSIYALNWSCNRFPMRFS